LPPDYFGVPARILLALIIIATLEFQVTMIETVFRFVRLAVKSKPITDHCP
jgi:hypothetical protein